MSVKLNVNVMNEVSKGAVLFEAGEPVKYLCVILKGRVEMVNQGSRVMFGNGCFLGTQDLQIGHYLNRCVAVDDSMIYVFSAEGTGALERILNMNKDYRGLQMYSAVRHIHGLSQTRDILRKVAEQAYQGLTEGYREYIQLAQRFGIGQAKLTALEKLTPPDTESEIDEKKLSFYLENAAVPLEMLKSFYGCGAGLTLYPLEQAGNVYSELILECTQLADYVLSLISCIFNSDGQGLLTSMAQLAMRMSSQKSMEETNKSLGRRIDGCMDLLNQLETVLVKRTGTRPSVDRGRLEKLYIAMMNGETVEDAGTEENAKGDVLDVLENSFEQIVKFACFDQQKSEQLRALLDSFEQLPDKASADDSARRLRHGITALFYELYEQAFLCSVGKKELKAPVELFLNFGYLSETLLTDDEKRFLLSCAGKQFSGPCGNGYVYTMREWLTAVYEGKREASKNEMDEDYMENLREQRKSNRITDEQMREAMHDRRAKLSFEIRNMFQSNNRLTSSQISAFVPVLHHGMFVLQPDKTMLDYRKIAQVVESLKKIDYSIFYRDVLYSRPEYGIDKIYVMKEYDPDIILLPTVGVRGFMWQECAGKRRESAGRFLFPVFMEEDLESAMAKTFGRYRWELCRFLQGGVWNNVQYHSLTSEYCDYVQFYRKNHELSDERKDKLKLQIQKAKNNTREVFVMDYEIWLRNESAGAVRLNKVAREILATYCPFSKDVRAQVAGQPIFDEALGREQRQRVKTVHDYELRVRQLEKELKGKLPQEITDTLAYYQKN